MLWFCSSLFAVGILSVEVLSGIHNPLSLPCLLLLAVAATKSWSLIRRLQQERHANILSRYADRQAALANSSRGPESTLELLNVSRQHVSV
ncbi:hypothetical protein [Planctomicrobium piriforme]|uniref:Uncharacterized protein n=1 Tax=Planctomicrobium piriforme TaxID=1576369 RepID=A0A1I3C272_9PLAN|nr:hypothetical protein [Planctomicrobium piriforme]SFH68698.1 hypothetical protein SAMN05421753_10260 [Planctomicrobium piriforme]